MTTANHLFLPTARSMPQMNPLAAVTAVLGLGLAACSQLPETGPAAGGPHDRVGTPPKLEKYACGNIERIHRSGGILLSSQPSAEDLAAARDEGVRTVVNFRFEEEDQALREEARIVRQLGMKYIHLPWEGGEELTFDLIDEMVTLLREEQRPILIHCDAYANRVGAAWLAYRAVEEGIDVDTATREARMVGLRSRDYETLAREYALVYGANVLPHSAPAK